VVERPWKQGGETRYSIFVAVAKGPKEWPEYLSDCVVYEFLDAGGPIAMTTLPRMVKGEWFQAQKDGAVWLCQGGGMVKLGLRRFRPKSDFLCRVDWFREPLSERREVWLETGPAADPISFGQNYACRLSEGGYVTNAGDTVYRFPFSLMDLNTGLDQPLELEVPFKGKLPEPKPKGGYARVGDRWYLYGPYLLGITRLQIRDNTLRVTLGMEDWTRTLEFDLDAIVGKRN